MADIENVQEVTEQVENEKVYRGISGIYVFDTVNGEKRAVCIEECSDEVRDEFLSTLSNGELGGVIKHLCGVINSISEQFSLIRR